MRLNVFLFLAFSVFALSSCLKNKDSVQTPVSYLNIAHASPKAGNLYMKLEPNWLTPSNFEYRAYTGYFYAMPGVRTFEVYKRATDQKFLSTTFSLVADKAYSAFLIDTLSKMEVVLLRDSTRNAGNDSVRIRFANFVPDAPAVDFYVQGNTTPVATNISFKTANNFFSMKAANDVVFEVKQAGQSTVLATAEKITLHNQNRYTIYASGYKAATDDAKVIVGRMRHF